MKHILLLPLLFCLTVNGQVTINPGQSITITALPDSKVDSLKSVIQGQSVLITDLKSRLSDCANPPTFQSNFEGVTLNGLNLSGAWAEFENRPYVEWCALQNNGSSNYAHGEIRKESGNTFLFGEVHGDDPNVSGYSRFQFPIKFLPNTFDTFRISYDVLWNKDIKNIESTSQSMSWFNIMEWWEAANGTKGNTNGQASWVLRWSRNTTGTIKWRFSAVKQQPIADQNMYTDSYDSTPIPFGEWVNLDVTFIRGQGTAGRVIVKITPRSTGITKTIFDIHNYTEYPATPLYIWQFHMAKLYGSTATYDFYRGKGWIISAYYDNFKLWLK